MENFVHAASDLDFQSLRLWTQQMSSGMNLHLMNNFKGLKMWFLLLDLELDYMILQLQRMLKKLADDH